MEVGTQLDMPMVAVTATAEPEAVPTAYVCVVCPESQASHSVPWALRQIWPCEAGAVIAVVRPAAEAPVESARRTVIDAAAVELGSHVAWNAEKTAVTATRAGRVRIRYNTLLVEEVLELDEDLDWSAGVVQFPGAAKLSKNVLDQAKLSVAGDLTVCGSIEAATVQSGGDVVVHRGICGKETGRVTARGNLTTRFATNARIEVGGDLMVEKELANSELICRGKCAAEGASVLSSRVVAGQGIVCDTAGSDAGIRVGLELSLLAEELKGATKTIATMKAHRLRAVQIRTAVEPLMKMPKRLTAAQKEKATELLCSADEAEQEVAALLKSLDPVRGRINELLNGQIVVKNHLYPNVSITIAGVQTMTSGHVRGPLKYARRDDGSEPMLVVIDGHNRATSMRISLTPEYALLRQLQLGQFGDEGKKV